MNLLPQQEIKIIKKEMAMRLIIIACFLIIFLEAVAVLILAPSYIIVKTDRDSLLRSVEQIKNSIEGDGSFDEELTALSSDIHAFLDSEKSEKKSSTDLIKSIISLRPKGISTNSISVIHDTKGSVIRLGGIGDTRESLIEYQRLIQSQDFIKTASYTEKFIIKKSNINYNLVITLK